MKFRCRILLFALLATSITQAQKTISLSGKIMEVGSD